MSLKRQAFYVLFCGAAVITLTLGIRAAFGLFLKPISTDLGVGREVFSFALAIQTLIAGLCGPIAGALADRYGSWRMALTGGLFLLAGLLLAPFANGTAGLQLTFGLLIGLALTCTSMGVVMGAVARALPAEKRSMGFGIIMAGGSFGQFLLIPIAQQLLAAWDWRTASQLLAIGALLVIPLAFGLRVARASGGPAGAAAAAGPATWREALDEAARVPGFWLLTASFFVCGFHVSFVSTHLPAFLTDRGVSGNVAAQALAFVGLFNIIGSFASGWLGGRYRHRHILVAIYLARGLLFLPMVLMPMSNTLALVFSAVMGLLYLSTVAPTSGMVAQIFGSRHFSMLYGIVFASHQIGGFLGAWLGGRVFDATGSYDAVWWVSILLAVLAAILAAPINDKPLRPVPARA